MSRFRALPYAKALLEVIHKLVRQTDGVGLVVSGRTIADLDFQGWPPRTG